MGWRGPGLVLHGGPMPALVGCFIFIMSLMWQPALELLGWQR